MSKLTKITTVLGTILLFYVLYYLASSGCLTDADKMEALISSFGIFAPIIFLGMQVIQVVIPIIPGGISSGLGVILFGPFWGFVINYLGIILGSLIIFFMVRKFGKKIILKLTDRKTYDKYIGWLDKGESFNRFFAIAVLIPGMPDDLLCMIASLTSISLKKYMAINICFRPFSLIAYSWFVKEMLTYVGGFI